ncbi:ammonium transporter Rh type B isoform 4-T4 [Spheniscus humboldti]
MPEHTTASRLQLSGLCFLLQILTIILFAVFVRYSPESSPGPCSQQLNCSWRNQDLGFQHPRFRDVHLQALLGFGLLVAFLGRYGPGSVAISILVVAFAIQWAVLIQGFSYFFLNGKIYVGAQSMVSADFCTAAILISTGAILGRVNPVQMLLLTLLGVTLFTLNEYILLSLMGVSDSGGSLTVHTFGAYFGLMVSRILHQPHMDKRKEQQDTGHQPDVFAVVGTIYLWIFWPSFTSATTVHDNAEPWAVLNTYFSLVASTLASFVLLPVLYEESTLRMAGARVPAGGPGQPDSHRPGALPALRPAHHPAARHARGQPHGWPRKDVTVGRAERSQAPAPWSNDPNHPVRSCTTRLNPLPASPVPGRFWQPEFPSSLLWRQPGLSPRGSQLLVPKVLGAVGCPRAFAG